MDAKYTTVNDSRSFDASTTTTGQNGGRVSEATPMDTGDDGLQQCCEYCALQPQVAKVETKARFQGKYAFLTYSAPTKDPENLWPLVSKAHIEAMCMFRWVNNPLKRYIIARETHKNGKQHFHVLLEWMTKPQFKMDFADLDVTPTFRVHPNIQKKVEKGKTKNNWWQTKWCYCLKQDPDPIQSNNNIFPEFTGFVKKFNDMEAWLQYTKVQNLKPCFPLTLFGLDLEEPRPDQRVRGFIFYGSPGCGKSKGMGDAFRDRKVYQRPAGDGRYPFDSYIGQQVIIYDDCMNATDEELIMAMNVHQIPTDVGPTRNRCRFWPTDQVRVIIWLCNAEGLYILQSERIRSRFRVYRAPECTYPEMVIDGLRIRYGLNDDECTCLKVKSDLL